MILKINKYKLKNNKDFLSIHYLNNKLSKNRFFITYCSNINNVNLDLPYCSFELNKINSINDFDILEPILDYVNKQNDDYYF